MRILCALVSVVFLCTSLVIWTYLLLSEMYKIVGREIGLLRIQVAVGVGFFLFGCGFWFWDFFLQSFKLQTTFFLAHVAGHKNQSSSTALNMTFVWFHKKLCLQSGKGVSTGLKIKFWGKNVLFLITGYISTGINVRYFKNLSCKCLISWISAGVLLTTF